MTTPAGIRASIAAYTAAVDDGRPEDVVATFCPDASVDIPGVGTFTGHEAIYAAFAGLKPRRSIRHVVVGTDVTDVDGEWAKGVSELVVLRKDSSGWAVHLVGRYTDVFHHGEDGWRIHERKLEFAGLWTAHDELSRSSEPAARSAPPSPASWPVSQRPIWS